MIADGGLATELEARGHDLSDALWSARLLADAPEEIEATHRAFFAAGARIATTASYQASFDGFAARGIGRTEAARLLRHSVALAARARDAIAAHDRTTAPARTRTTGPARPGAAEAAGHPGTGDSAVPPRPAPTRWVAASVGPYGAALADGSEYRGRYGRSVAALRDWHRPRLEVLAEAGPDLFALETVPDTDEAAALAEAVRGLGVPAWLSFTIAGDRTRAGQPLAEAFAIAAEIPEIVATGVNCCDPAEVAEAITLAREVTTKPVIVYPNSGEDWDPATRRWTTPAPHTRTGTAPIIDPVTPARDWTRRGAKIIGGCCRVRPSQIHDLHLRLSPETGASQC
ncbi:MAG: homocysteine S-methyltransferase [Streptosporangiales bacterium]|nr:homocysteine S-methyltransferase [Streptosporangiales bacterium]